VGDSSFYVYREAEPPAFDGFRPLISSQYVWDFDDSVNYGNDVVTNSWRPCLTRNFFLRKFGQYTDYANIPLPPPKEFDFTDWVLGLNAQGTKWYRQNRPGNPVGNADQFIGELHELPSIPLLLKNRLRNIKDIAGNYLNVEFGWKPLLNDIEKMYRLTFTIDDKLSRLIRNNGLEIRRRSKKEVTNEDEIIAEGVLTRPFAHLGDVSIGGDSALEGYYTLGPFGPNGLYPFSDATGSVTYVAKRITTTTTSNCGTFKYYCPDIGSLQWTERAKLELFGANPSPSTLWEVLPWSWLVDWFSNVGDIISNLQTNAVDNETLTNFFSMKTVKTVRTIEANVQWNGQVVSFPGSTFYSSFSSGSAKLEYSRLELHKLRQQASPFGFGVPSESFTARQWAILAALATKSVRAKPIKK